MVLISDFKVSQVLNRSENSELKSNPSENCFDQAVFANDQCGE